jgi:hypothetical protein
MCNGIQIGFCLIHEEGLFYVSKENLDLCPKNLFSLKMKLQSWWPTFSELTKAPPLRLSEL